jgi:hypothetical protein
MFRKIKPNWGNIGARFRKKQPGTKKISAFSFGPTARKKKKN